MKTPNSGILSLGELITLHHPLSAQEKQVDIDFDIIKQSPVRIGRPSSSKKGIYLLIQDHCPVYLGKSVEPFRRLSQHFASTKVIDAAYSFETGSFEADPDILSYVEFLCYYSMWSQGYCLIYNSLNVWNTLPIKSKFGPVFTEEAISTAHAFAGKFASVAKNLELESPDTAPNPIELELGKHARRDAVDCRALYWRPTIKKKQHEIALSYWAQESTQRPQFAGAGSFFMVPPSTGKPWGDHAEQKLTYDLLIRLGVLEARENVTHCLKSHPFPKANLMMGNLNGGQSITDVQTL
jgi:hypothetical protein